MLTRIDRNSIICDDIKKANGEKYLTSSDFGFDESSNIPEILTNTINAQALAETAAIEAAQSAAKAAESALEAETTVETFKANATEIVNSSAAETLQNIATTAENYIEEANIIKNDTANAQALAETAALEAIDAKSKSVEIKNEFDIYRNNGCVYSGDIILNGSKLLLANGASVELFTGEELPTPGGSGGESYPLPEEPIDTSDFATLSGDNEFSGNNNFTGNLTLDGKNILTKEDISSLPGKHNVGEQWISMDGTIPLGGVPFNGQILNIVDYQDLYDWAKNNGRVITETEWQTLSSTNNSNVSYYSDYSSSQFRMPNFSGYLKANLGAGDYIKEGLPNITGNINLPGPIQAASGDLAFSFNATTQVENQGIAGNNYIGSGLGVLKFNLNASRSSSIYGNSTHVTPETNTILIGVYAFDTIVNGSTFDAGEDLTSNINVSIAKPFVDIGYPYADSSGSLLALRSVNYSDNPGAFELFAKNATSQKILSGTPDGKLIWDGKDVVTLVESWSSTEKPKNGYRKYSNGFIEQWGYAGVAGIVGSFVSINLNTAFSNTDYHIQLTGAVTTLTTGATPYNCTVKYDRTETTRFFVGPGSTDVNYIYWYACGY